ncbi:LPS export ABC transporter periplasmic protein LptC [Mannheimia massilioguelmaensis]|uniref:LPS export ABC transporter periplasmic protein LptC n=1 Tax=Pasteurellaceae TaxID=712 RepID=UPI0005C9E1FC|nr:LPS export ABC transporter periplasmic protein LptC [Mannheimia massilioguelmaensis]
MNIRWNIILATIALVLLAWFYTLNQEKPDLTELIKAPESPEYIGEKMETTIFSPTGKKQYLAYSDKVQHYNNDGHTDFVNPVVYVLDIEGENKQTQSWKLTAKNAKLTKDNLLYLTGNVIAESLDKLSQLQKIETNQAIVNLKTQDITSDTIVTIQGLNFISSGLKMTGNLKQQIATLQEQVKTHYEINHQ